MLKVCSRWISRAGLTNSAKHSTNQWTERWRCLSHPEKKPARGWTSLRCTISGMSWVEWGVWMGLQIGLPFYRLASCVRRPTRDRFRKARVPRCPSIKGLGGSNAIPTWTGKGLCFNSLVQQPVMSLVYPCPHTDLANYSRP
jgi:hypothetical protein